ncbi:DUF998 domain-containing protein [Nonomuraea sp. NPDC001023]|uniref:DUF998 domain-containing protein n=1 Tax=unclassified Nonomuraea TaxID=2593643 RepID=UPI00332602CA
MTWRAVLAPVAGAVTAVAALGYAQVSLPEQPLISDYALVPGGMLPVLAGTLALAAACLSLAYGLAAREPGRTAATRVLLLAGAAGLMLSAIFPTDPGMSDISTFGGEIHRWSAAVVFTALPVAGWTLARGRAAAARWSAVKALSVTSGLTLVAYLAAHPAAVTSSLIGGTAYYGLLERGLVLAEIVLVVTMALACAPGRAAVRTQGTRATGAPAQPESPQRLAA